MHHPIDRVYLKYLVENNASSPCVIKTLDITSSAAQKEIAAIFEAELDQAAI